MEITNMKKPPVPIITVMAAVIICGLAACNNDPEDGGEKTLASIAVTTTSANTDYAIGDSFNPTGLVVSATYSNGSSAILSDTEYDIDSSGFDSAAPGGTRTITVSYEGKSTSFNVWVYTDGMIWIPAGTFRMGSSADEFDRNDREKPQHQVKLSSGFYMGKYLVTQKLYFDVTGKSIENLQDGAPVSSPGNFGRGGAYPVYYVNWYDAIVFCNMLSMKEAYTPAYRIYGSTDPDAWGDAPTENDEDWNAVEIVEGASGYRLPTEAQWEYSCRAGTTTAYSTGDRISDSTGWYSINSGGKTNEVGQKQANPWGLYDMHGNVYEWCWDWIGDYTPDDKTDPQGPAEAQTSFGNGNRRVERGGSWNQDDSRNRSAYRGSAQTYYKYNDAGIRLIRPR
jgi:formylglycine-generating enzyme required for sulfatase activity